MGRRFGLDLGSFGSARERLSCLIVFNFSDERAHSLQRQQTKLAHQTLQNLWSRDDLAQSLGEKLGTSFVLL